MMEILGKGAEAIVYHANDGTVVKERVSKSYRLPELDRKLRQFRTRREAKVLDKIHVANIPAPILKNVDDKKMTISMQFIDGQKIRDVLHENPESLSKEIGRKIGLLHCQNIIHSDLTTSNMILGDEIKFIDFGLSFFSSKIEDKAVDLHLFRQALESKHYKIWEKCFACAIEGYSETCPDARQILERLNTVEKRGRNKNK